MINIDSDFEKEVIDATSLEQNLLQVGVVAACSLALFLGQS